MRIFLVLIYNEGTIYPSRRKIMNKWLLRDLQKPKQLLRPFLFNGILKARIVTKNTKNHPPTCGLTNIVLNERRTMHQITDIKKKTEHLFRI